jgi:hypothetical protein
VLKRFMPIMALAMLGLGAQAEESQENPKCPDDPSEFKGKEDDCFDCLEGAFSKLKLFSTETSKMLDNKKLNTAEEAESMKTRSEGLWDGVAGWQKICEPNPESKDNSEEEGGASEAENEAEAEPNEEEGDAKTGTDEEENPESEAEGADEKSEDGAEPEENPESEAEPEESGETPEAEPEADDETQTEAEPEADA